MADQIRITSDCDGLRNAHSDTEKLYRVGAGSVLPLLRDDDRDYYKVAFGGQPIFVPKSCGLRVQSEETREYTVTVREPEPAAESAASIPETGPTEGLSDEYRLTPEESPTSGHVSENGTSVNLEVDYPERLSRWLLFVKWLLVIPAYIVLVAYGFLVFVTTFMSFWAILFTGRYPRRLFEFVPAYMALYARTAAYFPLLLTDHYPLAEREGEEEVRYEVEEPERLSRGLLLLKLVTFLLGIVSTLSTLVAWLLVLLVAIPAWFAILFTGHYPRAMFNFMVAVQQWTVRVTAWQWLMRDEWSLFATTRGVAYLVGAGAVVAAILQTVNLISLATGGS